LDKNILFFEEAPKDRSNLLLYSCLMKVFHKFLVLGDNEEPTSIIIANNSSICGQDI